MARREIFRFSLVAVAIASAFGVSPPAAARNDAIAVTGAQAPGLPDGVTFSGLIGFAQLNDAGQTAFRSLLNGPGVDFSNNDAIFRDGALFVRTGNAAPGMPDGVNFSSFGSPLLNNGSQVLFDAFLAGGDPATDRALYRDTTLLVQKGTPTFGLPAGVTFQSFSNLRFNDAGQAAFTAVITGSGVSSTNDNVIFRNGIVAREGQAAPGASASFVSFSGLKLNDVGQTAFRSILTGTGISFLNDEAIYRDAVLVAREGNPAPGLAGVNLGALGSDVALNNAGQVAFSTFSMSGTGVDSTNDRALYRDTTLVARSGDPAAGVPAGVSYLGFDTPALNDSGQIAFRASLTGAGVDFTNDQAIYRNTTLIVRKGNAVPGLPAGVSFSFLNPVVMNNAGHVAFFGNLTGPGVDGSNDSMIAMGDGVDLVKVVRDGDVVSGRQARIAGGLVNFPINEYGQLTYQALFSDGSSGNVLFTPDLRWRQNFSGSWDSAFNWTLGIAPAHVHEVRIDPSVSLTVSGPTSDRAVHKLEIGGGTGIATLALVGGKITALADVVRVFVNGVLTGDGTIAGGVVNQGTVRAQNLTIEGGLTNAGVVTGNGRLNASISNSTGRISVGDGESMRIGGTVNNSVSGKVDVIGGELETTGSFSNAGQLAARNALLRFGGGLFNIGQVAVSFGTTDVFGDVSNGSAGTIVVSGASNATFWDDVTNQGEVRASAGSSIVYFGEASGTGSFTGAGTHFFEGSVSPGASPGTLTVENSVFGPDNVLNIQLAGADEGEYDVYNATGSLTLDGALAVTLLDLFSPQANDEFDILNWATLSGRFDSISLPTLGFNLAWDTSDLYLDGTISVAAIPEPESYALLLAGLGLLGFAARRRIRGQEKRGQTPFSLKILVSVVRFPSRHYPT